MKFKNNLTSLNLYIHPHLRILALIILIAFIPRFLQLGYSHYYGDETKALYTQKAMAPAEFLFNQRKGPAQFIVTWGVETLTGGYKEAFIRFPFALAGLFSVIFVYLFMYELIKDRRTAFVTAVFFAVNGFFIAFSRTAQYQSLLHFFLFFTLFVLILYLRTEKPRVRWSLLILGAVSTGILFLTHYDAVFSLVPIFYIFGKKLKQDSKYIREILYVFFPVVLLMVGLYYVPYFKNNYFKDNTAAYLYQRALGFHLKKHSSLYTYFVYNPVKYTIFPLLLSIFSLLNKRRPLVFMLWVWFLIPFITFELVFSNPGTHIQNYIIPLIILAGIGIIEVFDRLQSEKFLQSVYFVMVSLSISVLWMVNCAIFIPYFNKSYPWVDYKLGPLNIQRVAKDDYQLFLYGFPYYRGWDKVADYLNSDEVEEEPRNYATNDNDTIAFFYLNPLTIYRGKPQYYIVIPYNQEIDAEIKKDIYDPIYYKEVKRIPLENYEDIIIYLRLR